MIIDGASRSNSAQAVWYLLEKNRGENETSRLIEVKGTMSQDVQGAALEWEIIAAGTRCKEFVYHISINLQEGEHLTPEQWEQAVEHTALRLGLQNNQRIVVEHEKEGRGDHQHVIFNRIDPDTGKAVNMGHDYVKHERAARELEKEFGLEPVKGRLFVLDGAERADRQPKDSEKEQAKRNGVNLKQWQREIRDILLEQQEANPNSNGHDLAAALERKGHLIAKGDKVAFVILDPSGTPQRMAQSLDLRIRNGEFAEHFGDINPETLPSVEEARARQEEYQAEQQKARAGHMAATLYDREGMAGQQEDALRHVRDKHKAREQGAEEGGGADRGGVSLEQWLIRQAGERTKKGGVPDPLEYAPLKDKDGKPAEVTLEQWLTRQAKERAKQGGAPSGKSYEELRKAQEQHNAKQQAARDDQQRQQSGETTQQGQTQSGAIGKERSQTEQRGDQKKARTEQTAEQIKQQQQEAMKENFERMFGRHSTAVMENYLTRSKGRERER